MSIPPPSPPPNRRVPERALPAYRFVPGQSPHPFRDPGGHMYTDGSAPAEIPWDPTVPWSEDPAHHWACELFDHRYYWEAHEAWEAMWHFAPADSPIRSLLQGLIQVAASVLKRHVGQDGGADRLQARSRVRLQTAVDGCGAVVHGIDVPELLLRLDRFHATGKWPLLPLVGS